MGVNIGLAINALSQFPNNVDQPINKQLNTNPHNENNKRSFKIIYG